MTGPLPRLVSRSGRLCAQSALAAFLTVAGYGEAESASARYIVIKLTNNQSYSAAYGRVNKQLTVLQSKRTGSNRRARCRNDEAIHWLAAQGKETESWQVAASETQRNDALAAELKSELAIQNKLQPCE